MASSPAFVGTPVVKQTQFAAAAGTTANIIYQAGASGSKLTGLFVTLKDATALTMYFYLGNNTVANSTPIWSIPIPANAGANSTIPAVAVFSSSQAPGLPVDNDGQAYLFLSNAATCNTLWANTSAATQTGNQIMVWSVGGDF